MQYNQGHFLNVIKKRMKAQRTHLIQTYTELFGFQTKPI
jgi:hypothetical protein